jgi:hypothetical protein
MADKNKPGGDEADRNVDQIRDILFGTHMRDYERRFLALEERVDAGLAQLRDQHDERFAKLERAVEDGFERLGELLRRETAERNGALDELDARTQERARTAQADIERRLAESDERQRSAVDRTAARFGEAEAALARAGGELDANKVGREDLAALLAEFAQRLRGDSGTPAR